MTTSTTASTFMPSSASTSSSVPGSSKGRRSDAYIKAGELIIIFASRDKTPIPLTVTPGEHVSNMFGHFPHDDMIGMPYGSKMISKNGRGYVYLLRPTPELWTLALPHRTQILYAPDMSFISMKLNMGPGSRVIEAGTGSGSFSHVIARTVGRADSTNPSSSSQAHGQSKVSSGASGMQVPCNWKGLPNHMQQNLSRGRGQPRDLEDANETADTDADSKLVDGADGSSSTLTMQQRPETDANVPEEHGRLWSFEFHEPRADKARAEFAAHGMDKVIVLNHRNVCKDGFGLTDAADSVFLDLPAPWEAIGHATQALRRDTVTRICCFSPCIEQVLKTVTALNEHGFTDVETFESLVRTHESHSAAGPEVSIDEAINRIRVVEKRKETRRLIQIEKARSAEVQAGSRNGATAAEVDADDDGVNSVPEQSGSALKRKFEREVDDGEEAKVEEEKPSTDSIETSQDGDATSSYQRGVQEGIAVTKKKARLMQQQTHQNQPIQAATVFSRPYYEVSTPDAPGNSMSVQ